jgi:hypothetical protein
MATTRDQRRRAWERVVPHPGRAGAVLYRVGDLGYAVIHWCECGDCQHRYAAQWFDEALDAEEPDGRDED